MGNNLTPYSIPVGYENVYFSTPYFKYVKKERLIMIMVMSYLIMMFQIVKN